MKIGIGLPSTIPGTPGPLLLDWASRAEVAGFSSLATLDRIVYPSYESLTALTGAGAVTDRIGLLTNVLLGPTRNPVLLAKQAASIDQLTGGRLTLGMGVGGRADDYEAAQLPFSSRGTRFDHDLEVMHDVWAGKPVVGDHPASPTPTAGPVPILIGGQPDLAAPRIAKWGAGFTIGGLPPAMAAGVIENLRKAHADHGGTGEPRIVALGYFALGDDSNVDALRNYYSFLGERAEMIAGGATRTADRAKEVVAAWTDLGIDEYIFNPAFADIDQIERLADAVL